MKGLFPVILMGLLVISTPAVSQNKVSLGVGIGYNAPHRWFQDYQKHNFYSGKNEGANAFIAPEFQVTPKVAFGLRIEMAGITENAQNDDIGIYEVSSLSGFSKYRFRKTGLSPFAQIGVGAYHLRYESPYLNTGADVAFGAQFKRASFSIGYTRILSRVDWDFAVRTPFNRFYVPIKFEIDLF